MLKSTEIRKFQAILNELKARLQHDFDTMTTQSRSSSSHRSSDPSDHQISLSAIESSFRLAANDGDILQEVKDALRRIERGTFGLCESCLTQGKSRAKASIPKDRLRIIPYARNCVPCEELREQNL